MAGTKLEGGMGASSPQNLENLPFRRAKTALQCTCAGQLTEARTI